MHPVHSDSAEFDPAAYPTAELKAAIVHLEDLEIFVGQRSRMHPGPGWAAALALIRADLARLQSELVVRSLVG